MDFPLRENCDPNNPEEAFLWMLVALPYQNGGQLIMPTSYLRMVSKRLWDCGARPVETPAIKYCRPSGSEPNWMTSPGKWVSVDAEDPQDKPIARVVAQLTRQQKAELLEELTKDG